MEADAQFSHWRRGSTERSWDRFCIMTREKFGDVLNIAGQRKGEREVN